jgi:two-component system sensor histidine kinase/response regulator
VGRAAPAGSRAGAALIPVTRVLLAEDNAVNERLALLSSLTKRGHDVTVARTGVEVLRLLDRESFDVILMDVQMPEMSGLEATRAIRGREQAQGGHVRIVAMTAHAMKPDRDRCLEAGMDGHLPKPVDRIALFDAVERKGVDTALAVAEK